MTVDNQHNMRQNTPQLFPDFDFMFYLLLLLSSLAAFFAAAFDPSGSLSFVILYTIKHKIALMMNR